MQHDKYTFSEVFEKSMTGDTRAIAQVLYYLYKDSFVSLNTRRPQWLVFDGRRWSFNEAGPRNILSTDLLEYYIKYQESSGQDVSHVLLMLKHATWKASIMKSCQHVFYNERVLGELDKFDWYLCFRNGILDLRDNSFMERGEPEWFISFYFDVEYTPDMSRLVLDDIIAFRRQVVAKRHEKWGDLR